MKAKPEPVEVWLPPEVCGTISHAQHHLDLAKPKNYRMNWRDKERCRRHLEKAQKLIARAKRLLNGREIP